MNEGYKSRGLVEIRRTADRFRTFPVLTDAERRRMQAAVRATLQRIRAILSRRQRRRAIQQTPQSHRLTTEEWQQIQAQYWFCCAYCYQRKPLTKDHVIPLSKGGRHTKENVIPACQACNSRKRDRDALQYNPLIFRNV